MRLHHTVRTTATKGHSLQNTEIDFVIFVNMRYCHPKSVTKTVYLHICGFQYIFMLDCCFRAQSTSSITICIVTYYTTQGLWWTHCGKVTTYACIVHEENVVGISTERYTDI
jgi:hypothetical protein